MVDSKRASNRMAESEKFATQAETGAGRTMARPAGTRGATSGVIPGPISDDRSLSGAVTNDAMPGGGATGDRPQFDTVAPESEE